MEKRLILTITLSLLILLSWSALVSKIYHIDNKGVTKESPSSTTIVQPPTTISSPEPEIPPASLFQFSQEKCEINFSEPQAAIKEVIFKDYQSYRFPLKHGFWLPDKNLIFKKEGSSPREVTFVYRDPEKQITKQFLFSNINYYIELEISIQNLSHTSISVDLPLVLGILDYTGDPNETRLQEVIIAKDDQPHHLNPRKDTIFRDVQFLGLRNRYFCTIIEPLVKNSYSAWVKKINPQETEVGLQLQAIKVAPGQKTEHKFRIYLGPQELKLINRINPAWSAIMHYGTFNFISHLLLQLLELLYRLVHNWGWAIVILSLMIYLLLYPLTLKQMHSMKKIQTLQPAIEELRQTHKDNPQKLNKAIMELYRKDKVNPFGGCLPLILQIPIFFALYQALLRSIDLKGAKFLWIKDLSVPDRLFTFSESLPLLGKEINILPIVMAIGMFIQQKLSMYSPGSSATGQQQKFMMILLPIMFGLIFYRMPSGLVLYWFINSTLMLIHQLRLSRKK